MDKTIHEIVREMEQLDKQGNTMVSEYVSYSLRDDVNTTEAYLNSKHISGEVDYQGREKPFFNIVVAARNIWYRATDLDTKNIVLRAMRQSDELKAFLMNLKLQEWMNKADFGRFLNDWGLSLANHGSSILKFVESDGELTCKVMDWNNMIVDPIDFDGNIKIEKFWLTPAQLRKRKGYNKEMVDALLDNPTVRKTIDGHQKDTKDGYIPIYEIHGELSLAQYKMGIGEEPEEEDDDEFFQQMQVVSFVASKEKSDGYDNYTLYCGKEAKDPYMITHLIEKDGMTYAGGAVKNLFQAQWMVNHNQKLIKDQLELASKIVFQTSDGTYAGQNTLVNVDNGDILVHAANQPLTMLNNKPDIGAMQAAKADWQNIAAQINGISEAMLGENPPSGTAWRQTQALLQESHSLFETMRENKGLYIKEFMKKYVLPYFKKTLNNSDEISGILSESQIQEIDNRYIPNEIIRRVNEKKKKVILSGQIYDVTQESVDMAEAQAEIQKELKGNQRFIKPSDVEDTTWKELFRDVETGVEIDVTGEARDVQSAMATLTTVLQTLATNPGVLQDPNIKTVFSKILSLSGGISPLELKSAQAMPQMPPQAVPQMAASVGGGQPVQPQPA